MAYIRTFLLYWCVLTHWSHCILALSYRYIACIWPFLLQLPSKLVRKCDFSIHKVRGGFFHPHFNQMDKLFGPTIIDWSNLYTLHTWHNLWRERYERYPQLRHLDENTIKAWNSTFGEVARYVYYGSPNVITWTGLSADGTCSSWADAYHTSFLLHLRARPVIECMARAGGPHCSVRLLGSSHAIWFPGWWSWNITQ